MALGKRFANHWMHHAFVVDAEGEKMSKSLGNFDNLLDLIETVDPRAFRMVLLQAHYRSPVRVDREHDGSGRAGAGSPRRPGPARLGQPSGDAAPDEQVLDAFTAAMDDDLDTPRAMAVVFDTVTRANAALDAGDPAAASLVAAVFSMAGAVGLELRAAADVPAEVAAQVQALDAARAVKDFETADALRSALQAGGWVVETSPQGTTVRPA